ncbi:MAG: DEAD/DEAH box helicase family protein [Methanobrevibacter sp.]|nr:DEAD/DEAH box helicase family protein [Clostridia bacterium]MBQ6628645.1 DEAD/DEAH box helicase family protein [Methanobrevibacter sp.]
MSFKDYVIKNEYRSLIDNVVQDFYIPLLNESVSYKRAVGFFSSSALVELSKGITGLIRNNGKIQIVASPYLSPEDIEAIEKGYEARDTVIENALLRQISDEYLDHYSSQRLSLLTYLISNGLLDIKIAFTSDKKGIGMYHEKMGIIEDAEGNRIAFSGSMNESRTAMALNYETIDVFCEWDNDKERERVEEKSRAFESIWENREPNIEVLEFPRVSKALIEKYSKQENNLEIDKEQFGPIIKNKARKQNATPLGARIPDSIQLFDYQKEAISAWVGENYRGIFDMATGTGKTFTGLGAIAKICEDLEDELAVLIVCPFQHLVEQWVEDIVKFNIKPIIGFSSSPQKNWKDRLKKSTRDQRIRKDKKFFCFVCTNDTFSSDFVQGEINKVTTPLLIVVDEAHNFGAESLSKLLDDRFTYRLALSATLERHRDPEGTKALYDFFGKKCIEYSLERAIDEDKLTKYKYYPVLVHLNKDELSIYEQLSYEMSKHLRISKSGKRKLDSYGEILAIKRSRVIAAAELKLIKLKEVIEPYKNDHFILVYCGATTVRGSNGDRDDEIVEDIKQIEAVSSILGNSLDMKIAKFTAEESIEVRNSIKEHFKDGDDLQAIVAIKCLDEGVNIPGIKTAFILASTTNPKEYIQRRGRVLRKAPNKEYAEIYDFVTLPRPLNEVPGLTFDQMKRDLSLVKNELVRVKEFGRLSMNSMKANTLIWDIEEVYHITDEDIKEWEDAE